jgi:uncharacterized membrane protein
MGIVVIVGFILILVSLNGLANLYKDRNIFNNAIYGVISAVVGGVIAVAVAFTVFVRSFQDFILQLYPQWDGSLESLAGLQGLTPNTNLDPAAIVPFLTGLLLIIVVVWIFSVIAAFFIKRSLKEVAVHSGTNLFSTAGLLLLIGAVLIIIGFGIILVWIAALVLAIAFFTMKPPERVPPPTTNQHLTTPNTV